MFKELIFKKLLPGLTGFSIKSSDIDEGPHVKGEEDSHYKYQCERLANYLLLKDQSVEDDVRAVSTYGSLLSLKWINKGELVSGSFLANTLVSEMYNVSDSIPFEDIDIFFKSIDDVTEFCNLNSMSPPTISESKYCVYRYYHGTKDSNQKPHKLNLVWSNDYKTPHELISRFDIRAISMAYDPNANMFYYLVGSISDAASKRIVFNPVPRSTSVQRLIKYVSKGFTIDAYQRLFFAELIRSDIYKQELELTTGSGVESSR